MGYPSWRYHRTLEPKLIQSADEEMEGWEDTPAKFEHPESYKEHMGSWEAKEEKKKPGRPKKEAK
jgi:hypothetical protein